MTTKVKAMPKSRPNEMRSLSQMVKGDLHIESRKQYPNPKDNRIDKAVVPKKELALIKKLKENDISGFKAIFYKYCYTLNVTSKAVKNNLANHPRELSHALVHIARAAERPDLCKLGKYGKNNPAKVEAMKKKAEAALKAKPKKKAKKAVKK